MPYVSTGKMQVVEKIVTLDECLHIWRELIASGSFSAAEIMHEHIRARQIARDAILDTVEA